MAGKFPKAKKALIRGETLLALLLVVAVVVNMICFGPMSALISLASGSGTVSDATTEEASAIALRVAEKGFVLLKNDNDALPLESGKKLNLFGGRPRTSSTAVPAPADCEMTFILSSA